MTVLASPRGTVRQHYCFGFDSTTKVYKVVRVFTWDIMQDPRDFVAQVYTLGTKSWRQISSVFPYRTDSMPVSAYEDIHWMISYAIPDESAESMIISFDFKREEFKLTPHPDFSCKICKYFCLVDLRGSLAIVDLSPTIDTDIWVLKDYDRKEWAQEYRISIASFYFAVPNFRRDHNVRVAGAWEEGLLFELTINYRFFYCNLKTGSFNGFIGGIVPRFNDRLNSKIHSFRGSLISLRNYGNLMVREVGTCDISFGME